MLEACSLPRDSRLGREEEFTPISDCSGSQNFPPSAAGSGSSKRSLALHLSRIALSWRLGSAPNSVPGASPAQLPYAARAASSAVRLRLSLRTSLLAGIVRFGALSNTGAIIELLLREGTDTEATCSNVSLHVLKPVSLGSIASKYLISFILLS